MCVRILFHVSLVACVSVSVHDLQLPSSSKLTWFLMSSASMVRVVSRCSIHPERQAFDSFGPPLGPVMDALQSTSRWVKAGRMEMGCILQPTVGIHSSAPYNFTTKVDFTECKVRLGKLYKKLQGIALTKE